MNIASVSGVRPSPNTAAYGAAKAGLLNATQTLAVELAPKVRVNAVVVGLVVTEQAHLFYGDEEGIAAVGETVPLGRMADPTDVADVCLFLASPLARYVSGAQVLVHGGGERPTYIDAARPKPALTSPFPRASSDHTGVVRPTHRGSGVLAADGDDFAGHVRREVGREEHDHVRDLPRLGGAAERLLGGELGEQLLGGDLGEVRRASRATARPR